MLITKKILLIFKRHLKCSGKTKEANELSQKNQSTRPDSKLKFIVKTKLSQWKESRSKSSHSQIFLPCSQHGLSIIHNKKKETKKSEEKLPQVTNSYQMRINEWGIIQQSLGEKIWVRQLAMDDLFHLVTISHLLLTLKSSTFLQRILRFKEIISSKNLLRIPLKTSLNQRSILRTLISQIQWPRLAISSIYYFQIINVLHSMINLNMRNIKKQSEIKMIAQHQLENGTSLNTTNLWLEDLKRTLDQEA